MAAADLPVDIIKLSLSKLPLHEFQTYYQEERKASRNPLLKYDERYHLKYGTYFPEVNHSFRTPEEAYLFCAGHFHREVGLRSHLFLHRDLCLRYAIESQDEKMIRYFLDRMGDLDELDHEFLYLLIENNQSKLLLELFKECEGFCLSCEVKIPSLEMAVALVHCQSNYFLIYKGLKREWCEFLREYLPEKVKEDLKNEILSEETIQILQADILAGETKAVGRFLLNPANHISPDLICELIAVMDDAEFLKDEGISKLIVSEQTPVFAGHCAVKCLTYLVKKGVECMNESFECVSWMTSIPRYSQERGFTMIEFLIAHNLCPSILFELCAIYGHEHLLETDLDNELYENLILNGHLSLLEKILKKITKEDIHPTDEWYLPRTPNNEVFIWILERYPRVLSYQEMRPPTYPELQRILACIKNSHGLIGYFEYMPVTSYQYFEFYPHMGDDPEIFNPKFILHRYTTFPPVTNRKSVKKALQENNIEYLEFILFNKGYTVDYLNDLDKYVKNERMRELYEQLKSRKSP